MRLARLDRKFRIAQVEADAQRARQIEQWGRFRARHRALEICVDLALILDIPARKEGRQRQFRIDDQIATHLPRLAHEGAQSLHHLRARFALCDRAKLTDRDIDKPGH